MSDRLIPRDSVLVGDKIVSRLSIPSQDREDAGWNVRVDHLGAIIDQLMTFAYAEADEGRGSPKDYSVDVLRKLIAEVMRLRRKVRRLERKVAAASVAPPAPGA